MTSLSYVIDLVCCVDITASMKDMIGAVKSDLLRFSGDIENAAIQQGKTISRLRVKVIKFGDCYVDGKSALNETNFLDISNNNDKDYFLNFVNSIAVNQTESKKSNGLEALALAIKSDWTKEGIRKRCVIGVWTDKSTYELKKTKNAGRANHIANMPDSFDELTRLWHSQEECSRRLILYAPDSYAWNNIASAWANTIHYPSNAGKGLPKNDYQMILRLINTSV